MTNPLASPRRRRPIAWALAGCGVLVVCVVAACVANAAFWTLRLRVANAALGAGPGGADALRAAWEALPDGAAGRGQAVFESQGCSGCHSVEPGVRIVGPSLAGVAERAASRKAGYPAGLYIYEAIVSPAAYTVEGFQAGVMPPGYWQTLTAQDLADVIAYLTTLQSGVGSKAEFHGC